MKNMLKPYRLCDKCFETIGRKNTRAARLWVSLCTLWLCQDHSIVIHDYLSEDLRILELLSYVTTTDFEDMLIVKVNGEGIYLDQVVFCPLECHEF